MLEDSDKNTFFIWKLFHLIFLSHHYSCFHPGNFYFDWLKLFDFNLIAVFWLFPHICGFSVMFICLSHCWRVEIKKKTKHEDTTKLKKVYIYLPVFDCFGDIIAFTFLSPLANICNYILLPPFFDLILFYSVILYCVSACDLICFIISFCAASLKFTNSEPESVSYQENKINLNQITDFTDYKDQKLWVVSS